MAAEGADPAIPKTPTKAKMKATAGPKTPKTPSKPEDNANGDDDTPTPKRRKVSTPKSAKVATPKTPKTATPKRARAGKVKKEVEVQQTQAEEAEEPDEEAGEEMLDIKNEYDGLGSDGQDEDVGRYKMQHTMSQEDAEQLAADERLFGVGAGDENGGHYKMEDEGLETQTDHGHFYDAMLGVRPGEFA